MKINMVFKPENTSILFAAANKEIWGKEFAEVTGTAGLVGLELHTPISSKKLNNFKK